MGQKDLISLTMGKRLPRIQKPYSQDTIFKNNNIKTNCFKIIRTMEIMIEASKTDKHVILEYFTFLS